MTIKSIKYLSVALLFAVSSCTYNQYNSTRGGYDDLYGGRYEDAGVVTGDRSSRVADRNANPDYQGYEENSDVVDQYYDENYITARNIQRSSSNQVGYNAGFVDGYYAGRNSGFFNGYNSMWGYPGFNIGFRMGFGSMISYGYSPWAYSRWNRWGSFYDPYWNSMAWGWSDPFMYGMGYGYPYSYGFSYGYPGFGYSPYMWTNYYPVIVNNYVDGAVRTRNYGPRSSGNAVARTASAGTTRRDVGTAPITSRSSARTSTGRSASATDGYYSRPRAASAGSGRVEAANSRVSGSRGAGATRNDFYYSAPNTNRSSSYSNSRTGARTSSSPVYRSSEGSRSTTPSSSYSSPSRSNTYSAPSRSEYSAPSRSYSAPSSTPSRSYSAPASSGGGSRSTSSGGGSRGPR